MKVDLDEISMLEKLVNKMSDGSHSGESIGPFMVSVGRICEQLPDMIKELRIAREVVKLARTYHLSGYDISKCKCAICLLTKKYDEI